MNLTSTLFCISLTLYFTTAKDLMCYTCFYHDDHPNSDSSCLHDPAPQTLKNCTEPLIPGLLYGQTPQLHLTLNESQLCHKYSAILNGKATVIRGCSLETDAVHFNCTDTAIVLFDGEFAKDTKACFCSANNCNDGPINTTNELPHNGASHYLITSNAWIAFIIYAIYKFVS